MPTTRQIEAPARFEIDKIKGSRFIGHAFPITSEGEVPAALSAVRAELPAARHYCLAWRLSVDPERFRYTDDGEPTGTAGRPILRQIDALGLEGVLVIVTRYFGGTKLGTGGLSRAYSAAAGAVLAAATIIERPVTVTAQLQYGYEDTAAVAAVLAAFDLTPVSEDYGASVTLTLAVPTEQLDALRAELGERSGGRVALAPLAC